MADFPSPPSSRPARSTRPDGCGATDPVQQRYQRGDHIATDDARINDRIRAREVLLIGAGGEQLGVKPLPEALKVVRGGSFDADNGLAAYARSGHRLSANQDKGSTWIGFRCAKTN